MPSFSMSNAVRTMPQLLDNFEHVLRKGARIAQKYEVDMCVPINLRQNGALLGKINYFNGMKS